MSKFYQYINEKLVSDEVTQAWEVLSKDCTEIIDFYRKSPIVSHGTGIFRGTKKRISGISDKIKPRKNRKPSDTPPELQKKIDEEFKKRFGWKPRSSGIFTFGDSDSHGYGYPYAVFPSNGFRFLWSPEIIDLYMKIQHDDVLYGSEIVRYYEDNPKELDNYIKDKVSTYTDKNLNNALLSDSEIIIGCDYYYLVSQNYWKWILDNYIKTENIFVNFKG